MADEAVVVDATDQAHVGACAHTIAPVERDESLLDDNIAGREAPNIAVGNRDAELVQALDECRQRLDSAGQSGVLVEDQIRLTQRGKTIGITGLTAPCQFVHEVICVHGKTVVSADLAVNRTLISPSGQSSERSEPDQLRVRIARRPT